MRIVTGQAPVVGGNAAGARERALDEAIRQAVDQTLNELLDPTPAPRAAAAKNSKAILAKARSFVPRYRTLDEGEANGIYTVRLEAEVDTVALRRRIDRGAAAVAPPAAAARPGAAGVLVAPGDRGDGTAAFVPVLVAALSGSGGLRARAPDAADPKDLTDAAAAAAAARSGLNQIARVNAEIADEGVVRGTGRVAVSCHATARVTGTAPGSRPVERSGQARVFVDPALGAGRADCLARLAGDLAPPAGRARSIPPPAPRRGTSGRSRWRPRWSNLPRSLCCCGAFARSAPSPAAELRQVAAGPAPTSGSRPAPRRGRLRQPSPATSAG